MSKRRILIEVEIEEGESLDPRFSIDPRMMYEIVPVDPKLSGSVELVCKRSEMRTLIEKLDKTGSSSSSTYSSRRIYDEPDREASDILKDTAYKLLGGLGTPVIDTIAEAIEDIVAPERARRERGR